MSSGVVSNKKKTLSALLTTSEVDIYVTPPTLKADIKSILVVNHSVSDISVTIYRYDYELATSFYIFNGIVSTKSVMQITDVAYFNSSDKIIALAGSVDSVTIHVSVEENFTSNIR